MAKENNHIGLVGCVDARLPLAKLGFNSVETDVNRTIASLIREADDKDSKGGNRAISGYLEQLLVVNNARHIAILGHTECGGIGACAHHDHTAQNLPHVHEYISPLAAVRNHIVGSGTPTPDHLRALEMAGVDVSADNLLTHSLVREKVDAGDLFIHRMVVNIATGQIMERPEGKKEYREMHDCSSTDCPTIEHIRALQRGLVIDPTAVAPAHNPTKLFIGGIEPIPSIEDLGVRQGDALIMRNAAAFVRAPSDKGEAGGNRTINATLEFAIKGKGVKEILVVGSTEPSTIRACLTRGEHELPALRRYLAPVLGASTPDNSPASYAASALVQSLANLREYPMVREAMDRAESPLTLRGVLFDKKTGRQTEYTLNKDGIAAPKQIAGAGGVAGSHIHRINLSPGDYRSL